MASILIIDDNEPFRATVKDLLEAKGHEVTLTIGGEDGIGQFQQKSFDLVLCDVFMPKEEGTDTIRKIRRLSESTPIISMTGGGGLNSDYLRVTRELGATRTIAKPFKVDEFLAVVRQCLAVADRKRS
jgi:DNA-binding response OmpR family regulator